MIDSQRDLEGLCDRLAGDEVVGVDTEYLTDRRFYPELCLVQVASEREHALIDPLSGLDLSPLGRVLADGPVVVMHNAQADAPLLARATGIPVRRIFDTMIAAGFLGTGELSLSAAVQRFLGEHMPKGATLTDWGRRPLSDKALRYALEDVLHLPALWRVMSERLAARGRITWAEDESERALAKSMEPPDPASAWRRIENVRRVRGVSLAVAAEVAGWRLRKAMELNRPVKRVMGDLGVLAIAESKPTTVEALGTQRGVDKGLVRDFGEEIVGAVSRALEMDHSEWPARMSPLPPPLQTLHDALGLAARMVAQSVDVAPWLAYEREDLAALADQPPRGRLTEGWRRDVLAPPLLDFLSGRAALTIEDKRLRFTSGTGST